MLRVYSIRDKKTNQLVRTQLFSRLDAAERELKEYEKEDKKKGKENNYIITVFYL